MSASDPVAALRRQLDELTEREAWFRARTVQDVLALKKTIKLLQAELEETQDRVRARETTIHELNLARGADRDERQQLEGDLEEYARQLAQAEAVATAATTRLQELRASPSWRLTSPLRQLGKRLARPRPATVVPEPAPGATGGPGFTYFFHTSLFRLHRAPRFELRGWLLAPSGRQLTALRAQLDSQPLTVATGLAEPDVVRVYQLSPDARPGFVITVPAAPGRHTFRLDAQRDDAADWITVVSTTLRVRSAPPVSP